MITVKQRICDKCGKVIKSFHQLRELQIIKRPEGDCLIDTVLEKDLCVDCSKHIISQLKFKY